MNILTTAKNRPIAKDALQYIPQTFGANGFDYERACEIALRRRLNIEKL